ncbi:MAG TPA: glycoside hydrolase family 127 protein [Cyclobacteriaceae bacterium]|nr:glycoside hydrolase family 127 protein [Cyclobacteriaceae bacterium]
MNRRLIVAAILLSFSTAHAQKDTHDYPIQIVDIRDVHLTDNFWLPKIKTIQHTTIRYGFDKCEQEGRMENFLIAGGKMEGKTRGKMPFDDTDVYKIIEGASYSLISAPDKKLDAYLDSIIAIIKVGQQDDGYLTTWHTIDADHPPASWVKPGKRWESEISSHELYNAGHLYEAAVAHYLATGKRNLLDIALKNADLLVKTFGPGKIEAPPGHQIVETGLIKLYRVTNKKEYLALAKYFLDIRGDASTHKLYGEYNQDHEPVIEQNEVVGHAVRAVYMYAGMTDVAALYGDEAYLNAVKTLWENMVNKKMYITGGIGARHEGESFGDNYELPNLTAYNETCAAIGDVYWNQRMFMLTGDAKYYDVIERSLYNGLISGISLDGDEFFYPNPLEADGKYTFNQGALTRSPWFDCSCCPTNLVRFIPSMPNLIYATQQDTAYVNLYASSHADMTVNGNKVRLAQETLYPWNGNIKITVAPEMPKTFVMKLRIPGWSRNQVMPGDLYQYIDKDLPAATIKVNGKEAKTSIERGYVSISRKWKKGDIIELTLPMRVRRVVANNNVKMDENMVALEYGPVVYCIEGIDNENITFLMHLPDNSSLTVTYRQSMLSGVNIINGKVRSDDGKEQMMTAIPYYVWSNRGAGTMRVWLPRE